jgi:hypothetical protein
MGPTRKLSDFYRSPPPSMSGLSTTFDINILVVFGTHVRIQPAIHSGLHIITSSDQNGNPHQIFDAGPKKRSGCLYSVSRPLHSRCPCEVRSHRPNRDEQHLNPSPIGTQERCPIGSFSFCHPIHLIKGPNLLITPLVLQAVRHD